MSTASVLVRTSRLAGWSPHRPQIYKRCPQSLEWGVKGRMPVDGVLAATFTHLDHPLYRVPSVRDASAKLDAVQRWREMMLNSGSRVADAPLPNSAKKTGGVDSQAARVAAAGRNVAAMPLSVFHTFVRALKASGGTFANLNPKRPDAPTCHGPVYSAGADKDGRLNVCAAARYVPVRGIGARDTPHGVVCVAGMVATTINQRIRSSKLTPTLFPVFIDAVKWQRHTVRPIVELRLLENRVPDFI